jgi:hypothetical protein
MEDVLYHSYLNIEKETKQKHFSQQNYQETSDICM